MRVQVPSMVPTLLGANILLLLLLLGTAGIAHRAVNRSRNHVMEALTVSAGWEKSALRCLQGTK